MSQRAPRAALVGNGTDPLSSAPDVMQPQPWAQTQHRQGTWPSAALVQPVNGGPVIPAPVQSNSFKKQDIPEHKSVCYKVGRGFPWLPPAPAEFH